MIISRKLENKVRNRLQLILSAIEVGHTSKAVDLIHQLSRYLREHVESVDEEKARSRREEESS